MTDHFPPPTPPTNFSNSPEPVQPKSRRGLLITLLVVVSMVLGGFVGAQIAQSGDDADSSSDPTQSPTTVVEDESNSGGSEVATAPTGEAPGSSDEPVVIAPVYAAVIFSLGHLRIKSRGH